MRRNIRHSIRSAVRSNYRLASELWREEIKPRHLEVLRDLTERFSLSVERGDIQLLNGNWYVTHAGLLGISQRRRCYGIRTSLQKDVSNPITNQWVFKATIFKSPGSKGFDGYGDANPSNVSLLFRGTEMRMAETRAVSRALRKAYGVPICALEELKYPSSSSERAMGAAGKAPTHLDGNGSANGQPKLRDKLCLLIRRYELDPNLIKRYAADFCGTETLRDASRDLVEAFVSTVADEAANNRAALVCKLNSYNQPEEVRP